MADKVNFLGFKQVTANYFANVSDSDKKGYIWFVRNLVDGQVASAQIYLGTRLYGEMNQDAATETKLDNLIETLGLFVDENGEWVGFLPEDSILNANSAHTLTEALQNLVSAFENEVEERKSDVKDINDLIGEPAESGETVFGKIADLEESIEDVQDAIDVLNGDGEGSVKKTVDDAIAEVVSGAPETFDTLKEIADWIEEHGQEATKIFEQVIENSEDILENQEAIEGIKNKLEEEDTLHMIYGDDVEEMTDEEVSVSKIKNVVENGGTAVLGSNVALDETIEIK